MNEKSSVSILHEHCAKNGLSMPQYIWIDSAVGPFVCRVYVEDIEAEGIGRSKRDAKHNAAARGYDKLVKPSQVLEEPQDMPPIDMITALRDYCVEHNIELPIFEIVHEGGAPDNPKFMALCKVASIKRIGISEKKKDARQKAATAIFNVIRYTICSTEKHDLVNFNDNVADVESERYRKFKTYRELTESNIYSPPGVLLCERHYYFTNFHDELKLSAKQIFHQTFKTEKERALDVLKSLKIIPKINVIESEVNTEVLMSVEFNCEFDVYLINTECKIFSTILNYFNDMLS